MSVRNVWFLFNLKESPFYQEALQVGDGPRPVEQLFVGRHKDVTRILNTIASSGGSSRQAISGAPGVGKSSLAQYIKAQVSSEGLLSTPEPVALGHADDLDTVATRILGYVYQAIVANGDAETRRQEAVEDVRQLVRAFRTTTALSGGVSSPMGGFSVGRSRTYVTPSTARPSTVISDLLRRLAVVVREHLNASGVLVHVNNSENLAKADAERAARLIRDLRDHALLIDGYHWILVGTTDAIRRVVFSTDQVRTVVEGPRVLSPLPLDDVFQVLARRYEVLRADPMKPVIPPVTEEVIRNVFTLFRGDLRGTMAALHTAAHELLSFGREATSPLTLGDVRAVLHERYQEELSARLGADADRVAVLAEQVTPGQSFTQKQAERWWRVSQTETSRTVGSLIHAGYVVEVADAPAHHPDRTTNTSDTLLEAQRETSKQAAPRGRRAVLYVLSGAARLVFDPLSAPAD